MFRLALNFSVFFCILLAPWSVVHSRYGYNPAKITPHYIYKGPKDGRKRYGPLVVKLAKKHKVSPALVESIIEMESRWNASAKSNAGAKGLMQLMPATCVRYGVHDAYDPKQNISGGIQYLKYLLYIFDNDLELAIAAYNAGHGKVLKSHQIPKIAQTEAYVKSVMKTFDHYLTYD